MGHWETVVPVAVFFELLWLDTFYIGAYIPPSASTCLLLVLAVHSLVNGGVEHYLLSTIIISIPCALGMIWVEQRIRQYNNHWYTSYLAFVNLPPKDAAQKQVASFGRFLFFQGTVTTAANLALFWTMLILVGVIAQVIKNVVQTFPLLENFVLDISTFEVISILLFGGFLGACLSLRFKKAQALFFVTSIIIVWGSITFFV